MVTAIQPLELLGAQGKISDRQNVNASAGDFAKVFENALQEVNRLQIEADQSIKQMATGEVEDIHQVMLAAEQANLALQLTVQVRNKLVEAYQEISRMQF